MLRFAKKFIRSLFPCTYEESSSNSQCTGTRNGLSCCILQCRKTSNSAKYSQQFTYIVHYPLPNTNIITEEFSPFHLSTQSYFPQMLVVLRPYRNRVCQQWLRIPCPFLSPLSSPLPLAENENCISIISETERCFK